MFVRNDDSNEPLAGFNYIHATRVKRDDKRWQKVQRAKIHLHIINSDNACVCAHARNECVQTPVAGRRAMFYFIYASIHLRAYYLNATTAIAGVTVCCFV